MRGIATLGTALLCATVWAQDTGEFDHLPSLTKVQYRNPGLVVDLAVGLWAQPLPMDFDGDGDYDMVAATNDVPSNGIYFFENVEGDVPDPGFKAGRRIGAAQHNITVSHPDGSPAQVLTPGRAHQDFATRGIEGGDAIPLELDLPFERIRANQWKVADYNGDGRMDLVIGVGVWDDYGWDDAFTNDGEWTNGPLHGYVYIALGERGPNGERAYAKPFQLMAGGEPIDTYGAPSPNLADFDGDGDLDLICGEFLDGLTYFENIGTRTDAHYAKGRPLSRDGKEIRMDLQMLQVVSMDWDKDGHTDLIVGQEDGRVAFVRNTGEVEDRMPVFDLPRFFRQEADALKVGVLPTPVSVDWDGDGDEDLITGDTAGYINFVENIDGGNSPKWAPPVYLKGGGETIRIQAGTNGGIQGPCEKKWGYTVVSVGDWNHDGLPDIVLNSIWGEVLWYENVGTRSQPELAAAQTITVDWPGDPLKPEWCWWTPKDNQLATQWRTSPFIGDLTGDGLTDLVMLDHEGYLALFERSRVNGELRLSPGKRVMLDQDGAPLRLNKERAGPSGRRKFTMADWDGDGRIDILINGRNIDFLRNVGESDGTFRFQNQGPVARDKLAGHTTCPTVVDWDQNGIPDLLISAEDGYFYYVKNPRAN